MKNLTLIDRDMNPSRESDNAMYPSIDYQIDQIANLGSDIERQRLGIISGLIKKRKKIRDDVLEKIEDIILYCDNKILDIGDEDEIKGDLELQRLASSWQQRIIELEMAKIGEQKEMFKDCLFLRNEWVKSVLKYYELNRMNTFLE